MLSAILPEERPELINLKTDFGETSVHWSGAMDFSRANSKTYSSVLNNLDEEDRRKVYTSRKHQQENIITVIKLLLQSLEPPHAFNLVHASNKQGKTVIHVFAEENIAEGIKYILTFFDVEDRARILSVRDENGQLAIHVAAEKDHKDALLVMLESFSMGTIETILSERDNLGMTPLHLAPYEPPMLVVKLLVDLLRPTGRKIKVIAIKNAQGKTAIQLAAQRNDVTALKHMLKDLKLHEKVALLELKDRKNHLAIDCAYRKKHLEAISYIRGIVTGRDGESILDDDNYSSTYPLPTVPAVLMFYMTTDRLGAEEDLQSLKAAFASINIPSSDYRDMNRLEVLNAIGDSCQLQSNLSALIVVTMSHGDGTSLLLRDGEQIAVQDIIDEMDKIPPGIPKVLIIQACRGQHKQCTKETDATSVAGTGMMLPERFYLHHSDFLILCSCVHDSVSYRNVFVPYLARELNNSQENADIYDVFLGVSHWMFREKSFTPEFISTMTKRLQLKKKPMAS